MLVIPLAFGVKATEQQRYKTFVGCIYWPLLGSLNNQNIIHFTNENISSEELDEVHQVVLDRISDNMASFVQKGGCGTINEIYETTLGYYVLKYFSESYTLQNDM